MKNASTCAGRLEAVLARLEPPPDEVLPVADDPVETLIHSFLLWGSTSEQAGNAYRALKQGFVDHNELRVSLPYEIALCLRQKDSRSLERCQRLRASLNDLFRREHVVSLDRVRSMGKRDARKYIETLEGMVPYVSARVMLLCFDIHVMPVDDPLRALLIEEGAADPSADCAEVSAFVSRHVPAARARDIHARLQAWSDCAAARLAAGDGKAQPSPRRGRRTAGKRSNRKPRIKRS